MDAPAEPLSGRSETKVILPPSSGSWTLPGTSSYSTSETLCMGSKPRDFPALHVMQDSDFPRGEITAALLLRKKRVPARVRHASESTRHHHKNQEHTTSSSTSTPRVFDDSICKKRMGFHERDQVLEVLLYQSAIDHQIDPNISDRLEQKIDYLIETIDIITA